MSRQRRAAAAPRRLASRALTRRAVTAQVPVPGPGARPVSTDAREAGLPSADVVEGWFPFLVRAEGDYEAVPPPPAAGAEVYVHVSFAERAAHGGGYCEAVRQDGAIAQPMDSYSNVAFVASGLHMIAVGVLDVWRRHAALAALPLLAEPPERAYASLSQMERFPVYSIANGLKGEGGVEGSSSSV